jgi:hypothetical protein
VTAQLAASQKGLSSMSDDDDDDDDDVVRIMTGRGTPQHSHAALSTAGPTRNLTEFLSCRIGILFCLPCKE